MNLKFHNLQPDARAALFSIVFFWAFYFAIVTLRSFVMWEDPLHLIPRRSAVVLVGAFITWVVFLSLRALEKQPLSLRMAAHFIAAIPASAAYGAVNHAFFYLILPPDFIADMPAEKAESLDAWHMILESAISWYWFFSAWAAFYLALRYAADVRIAERRAAAWRAEAQSAQLRALRYQVNPHFLFNTLNSLSSLILREKTDDAEKMVLNLSAFLRTSLTGDPEKLVALSEEIEQQRLYLEVERIRFGDRLDVDIDIDPQAMHTLVPPMILQPIIENAIKYAVAPSKAPVLIQVHARRQNDRIEICISDDGQVAASPLESGFGTGLANVSSRITGYFGGDATFTAGPGEKNGYVVRMSWLVGQRR